MQKSVASGEDKILAAIEAMKVELRAEMKSEIATVKKSVSLDDRIPQFKSGQPSNYFEGFTKTCNHPQSPPIIPNHPVGPIMARYNFLNGHL